MVVFLKFIRDLGRKEPRHVMTAGFSDNRNLFACAEGTASRLLLFTAIFTKKSIHEVQ